MITQIFTCLLLVAFSDCCPGVKHNPAAYSVNEANEQNRLWQRNWDENSDHEPSAEVLPRNQLEEKNTTALHPVNDHNPFRRSKDQHLVQNETIPVPKEMGTKYWDFFAKTVLPAISKAMEYITTQENPRLPSLYNNANQSEKILGKEIQQTDGRKPVKKIHFKISYAHPRTQSYPSPGSGFSEYRYRDHRRGVTPEGEDDDDISHNQRALGMLTSFMKPILGLFENTPLVNNHHQNGELLGLEKARKELQAAQKAKDQFQAQKLKNQAEVNRLKMELEWLKMQKEVDHAREEEMVRKVTEQKLEKLREEMSQKLQNELQVSQLHQHSSNLVINRQKNKKIIDRVVYQPVIEYYDSPVNDMLTSLPNAEQSNDLKYQIIDDVMEDSLPYCDEA